MISQKKEGTWNKEETGQIENKQQDGVFPPNHISNHSLRTRSKHPS